jgi:hypothetical protein
LLFAFLKTVTKIILKAQSIFLFRLTFAVVGLFLQCTLYKSEPDVATSALTVSQKENFKNKSESFGLIYKSEAAFETTLTFTGSYLKARTSFL